MSKNEIIRACRFLSEWVLRQLNDYESVQCSFFQNFLTRFQSQLLFYENSNDDPYQAFLNEPRYVQANIVYITEARCIQNVLYKCGSNLDYISEQFPTDKWLIMIHESVYHFFAIEHFYKLLVKVFYSKQVL